MSSLMFPNEADEINVEWRKVAQGPAELHRKTRNVLLPVAPFTNMI